MGVFATSLAFKSFRIRLQDSPYLVFTALSAMAFLFSMILMGYYLYVNPEILLARLFQKIGTLCMLMTFIAGYFYYEGFVSISPPTGRLTVMSGLFVFLLGFNLLNIFDQLKDPIFHPLSLAMTFLYGVSFHVFAIRVLRRVLKLWNRTAVKIDLLSLGLVGFYCLTNSLGSTLEMFGVVTYLSSEQLVILSAGTISFIAGMTVLIFNNAKFGQYIYHIPFPIHQVLIYGPGGLLVYGRKVTSKEGYKVLKKDEILVSAALSAFSTFFKESLGIGAVISHINATEYEFFFVELPKESGTIILLTSGANKLLQTSLSRFKRSIPEDVLAKIRELSHDDQIMGVIDDLVMKAFPYLVVDKFYSPFTR